MNDAKTREKIIAAHEADLANARSPGKAGKANAKRIKTALDRLKRIHAKQTAKEAAPKRRA